MQTQAESRSVEQIVAAIQVLDLDPIKLKLMDREEGQGWSREYVDLMEVNYKRFLTLLVKYPQETIAPSKDVDKFWHGHILDTMKYAEDCENVFGYFLHHFPYFGMRGEEDAANLAEAGRTIARLYEQEFGESASGSSAFCGTAANDADAAFCGASKPAFCGAAGEKSTSAFCGASKPAFCGATSEKSASAFCGASKPAFCGAAGKKSTSAFCGAAKPMSAASAFCGAAKPAFCGVASHAKNAFCGASKPAFCGTASSDKNRAQTDKLNVSVRPKLPIAA